MKECDNTSVGMIVREEGNLLLIERGRFPFGYAPPAGHLDGNSYEDAARRELEEEVGLQASEIKLIAQGRKENMCRRDGGSHHDWKIYEVQVSGELDFSPDEVKQGRFYTIEEIKTFSERTHAFLSGSITDEDWQSDPGLEPVWDDWFRELKII